MPTLDDYDLRLLLGERADGYRDRLARRMAAFLGEYNYLLPEDTFIEEKVQQEQFVDIGESLRMMF